MHSIDTDTERYKTHPTKGALFQQIQSIHPTTRQVVVSELAKAAALFLPTFH